MNKRNPSISEGIFQSISKLKDNHEFEDLQVEVDGEKFSCHSFILASCSDFFNELLRSDMREKHDMVVHLKGFTSPIFQLILNTLYTGCELLTKENVLEVWSAVHQLQIKFLLEHCEIFVIDHLSLDTVEVYKDLAEYLQSVRIREYNINCICKHFGTFRKTKALLRMNFQDLMEIIRSDKLEVSSEDDVLYSIFDWVSYEDSLTSNSASDAKQIYVNVNDSSDPPSTTQISDNASDSSDTCLEIPNENPQDSTYETESSNKRELAESVTHNIDSKERNKMLETLLKATRYSLASEFCLTMLYENKATQNNTKVKDILFEALSFKSSGYCNGFCPTSAVHRDCSNLRDVCVYCSNDELHVFSFKKVESFSILKLPNEEKKFFNLAVLNEELYVFLRHSSLMHEHTNRFASVFKLTPSDCFTVLDVSCFTVLDVLNDMFIANDKFLYCFSWDGIARFNPNNTPIEVEKFSFPYKTILLEHAFSYYKYIILFSSEYSNKTCVYTWNTETQVCTKLAILNFLSINMVSFSNGRTTYILDSNGNLWKLTTQSETIGFTFVKEL